MQFARNAFVIATASLVLGASGCRRFPLLRHKGSVQRSARGPRVLPPLASSDRIDELELSHFETASVFAPTGTRIARPIVLAIHAQDETPRAACDTWSSITNHDYFVLCPALGPSRGANGAQSSCTSVECLADELREGLVGMRHRFGRYIAPKEVMLVGRATGAARVVPIALQNPTVFSVVWLVDGGLREWSSTVSVAYAKRGGKFLGIVCGGASCEREAQRVGTSARMAGLGTAFLKSASDGLFSAPATLEAVRLSWQSSKPAGWPWSAHRKSEHSARPDG